MSIKVSYQQAIRDHYESLGRKKRKIADILLNSPMQILDKSVAEFAAVCECEQTTIVRFAQQLNYSGYAELKIAVARESNAVWQDFTGNDEREGGKFKQICHRLAMLHAESVRETLNNIKEEQLDHFIDRLGKASKVMVAGAGTSQLAASDLHVKLSRLGVNCLCFADHELWKTFVGYLGPDDMLILFSSSGTTEQIVKLAKKAHGKGIPVAAVTSAASGGIAGLADHVFLCNSKNEHPIRLGAMTSRSAQFAIVDIITLEYSMRDKERSWEYLEKSYDGI